MNLNKFKKTVSQLNLSIVYVGFSGGADSTALLELLHRENRYLNIKIKAVHFNHGIRNEDSEQDSVWCENFCNERDIEFELIQLFVPNEQLDGEGVEAAARRLRLAGWDRLVKESGESRSIVVLAHHADDRVENTLLRMIRGANVSGITSLRYLQKIGDIKIVRPLIEFKREAIINFLRSNGLGWREDYTNQDNSYKRNFFRNKILPQIYDEINYSHDGALQSIKSLEIDADFIESKSKEEFAKCIFNGQLLIPHFKKCHVALRVRILRLWLSSILESEFIPDRHLIERLNSEIEIENPLSGEKRLIPIKGGLLLMLQKGVISLYNKSDMRDEKNEWIWGNKKNLKFGKSIFKVEITNNLTNCLNENQIECFDADLLPAKLILKNWTAGDKMVPFGRDREIKLKKIFSNNKILAENKREYPLLCNDSGDIIWIAGVKRSDFYKITDKTEKYAYFTFEKNG